MLNPSDIVKHLQECLPLFTDRFHDELPVTSGSVSNGIFTITFTDPHGLQVNDQINIPSALIRNRITNVLENADGSISYQTESEHDLTAYRSDGHGGVWPDGLSVLIEFPTGNQTIELLPDASAVPNPNEFTAVEGSIEFIPSGEEYLLENRSYGVAGIKSVQTVVDPNTITIDLSDVPEVPDGPVIIEKAIANIRIAECIDLDRAEKIYSDQQNSKAWLYVIMLDRRASKSRENDDDLSSLPNSSLKLLNIMQEFSTLVILPTDNELAGEETKRFVYDDLFVILNSCLYGWEDTGYNNDGQVKYTTSFYSHSFEWQTRQQINYIDGYINNKSTDLRTLQFDQTIFDEGESLSLIHI